MFKKTQGLLNRLIKGMEKEKELYEKDCKKIERREKRLNKLNDTQKELYDSRELYSLTFEFWYIYRLLCKNKIIEPLERIRHNKTTKWYDEDIVTLLCLMKYIHSEDNYKDKEIPIPNRKLLSIRWLSLDKKYLNWNKGIRDVNTLRYILKYKQPSDYLEYLKNWDLQKFKNKNSFHKYKETAEKNWLKGKLIEFLRTILSEIDVYQNLEKPLKWKYGKILSVYKRWFENIVENLPIKGRREEEKFKAIKRKYIIDWYEPVLNVIDTQYRDDFYKYLWLR